MTKVSAQQKVLIVDDEPRNVRIIEEILEGLVIFESVSSGELALEKMETFHPDLVLLDIMMPGIDGYEVCRKIRSKPEFVGVKIILVSGKAMVEERLKGYEDGADDYMTKPFVAEELLAKTKVFLRLRAVEADLGEMNRTLEEKVEARTHQLMEAEAKLMISAKMSALGEMAGGIAHEINTPLSILALITHQIKKALSQTEIDREEVIRNASIASDTIDRIAAIIKGLRTFSRDGNRDQFESASVRSVLDSTLSLCGERLKNSEIKIDTMDVGEGVIMHCRPVQISQVFLNLINNACDAIDQQTGKWIKISAELKDGMVYISFKDSGKGISAAVRDKMFQPFFTTKDVGKGTGLGLSVSKGIMDSHQGMISIDETCPTTCFLLTIPMG